jgi:hypothetical protein
MPQQIRCGTIPEEMGKSLLAVDHRLRSSPDRIFV